MIVGLATARCEGAPDGLWVPKTIVKTSTIGSAGSPSRRLDHRSIGHRRYSRRPEIPAWSRRPQTPASDQRLSSQAGRGGLAGSLEVGALMDSLAARVGMARDDRSALVPVIGAGASIDFGLPSWKGLLGRLGGAPDRPPGEELEHLEQHLGQSEFAARVQQLLRAPLQVTTLLHQALISGTAGPLITLNLDHALEQSFTLAQTPLMPKDIMVGTSRSELSRFTTSSRCLLKLHGSLERPDSWVLTAAAYDRAYAHQTDLVDFLRAMERFPLFVGCGFADTDIDQALRVRRGWSPHGRAYAIVSRQLAIEREAFFKRNNIITLPYRTVRQISELIDEIFGCPPLNTSVIRHVSPSQRTEVRVAAARVTIDDDHADDDAVIHRVTSLLANAVDPRPAESFLDGRERPGRRPIHYLDELRTLVKNEGGLASSYIAEAFLGGLRWYPDVLSELSRRMITAMDERTSGVLQTDREAYVFANLLCKDEGLDHDSGTTHADWLADVLQDVKAPFSVRRGITKSLASKGLHPACRRPVSVRRVGPIDVMTYLITEALVAWVRDGPKPRSPAMPYVVSSLDDALTLVEQFQVATGRSWRLPTLEEWLLLAGLDGQRAWPWGDAAPEWRVHAHLYFPGIADSQPGGAPYEVGLYPAGVSPAKLFDVVGNLNELVETEFGAKKYRLVGGSYATRAGSRTPEPRRLVYHHPNTGLRLVSFAE